MDTHGHGRHSAAPDIGSCECVGASDNAVKIRHECSICGHVFAGDDEAIDTAHVGIGYVTACWACYNSAGNDVR